MEKTPEYDRICKLLNQPLNLSSSFQDSSSSIKHNTQQQLQQTNLLQGQQQHQNNLLLGQQRQQTNILQGPQQQQQLKHNQLQLKQQQQHQRQLKQQLKNQQQHNKNQLQQQYNALGRADRTSSRSSQQNRSAVVNNDMFGMENTNRRNNFRVRIFHGDCHYH